MRRFRKSLTFWVILTGIIADVAEAQIPAPPPDLEITPLPRGGIIPRRPEPPLPETPPSQLPTPEEILPSPSLPTRPDGGLPDTEPAITVTEFQFTGNTVFSSQELAQKFTVDITNKPLPLSRLLKIAYEVTSLYAEKGYSTSGAIISIPRKTRLQGKGKVEIRVIEGELKDKDIIVLPAKGTLRLNPNYVRSRLKLGVTKPLNIERLQEALQLLQIDPLIERVYATLSDGPRPGQSVLEVKVAEAPSFKLPILADNSRSPSVGTFQRGIGVSEANLFGLGHELSLIYTNTDGSNAIDASYTMPINPRNGTLRFTYNYIDSDVVEPPFNRLDLESESTYYQLTLRQPIQGINRKTQTFQEIGFGLIAFWRETESSLLGTPYPLSPGADDKGRTRIFALRYLTDWTWQSTRSVIALRSEMSFGLDAFNATVNEQITGANTIPDSRFFVWGGQAQWVHLLATQRNWEPSLLVRSNIQVADDALLPSEQFGIGGFGSVRGYRQDALLTDNGFFVSAEVRLPILKVPFRLPPFRVPEHQGVVHLIPFSDYGLGWNSAGNSNPDPQQLASVGLGLQWRQGDNFTARFDWGIPLLDIKSPDRTLQENGLYFSMQWNLF